MTVKRIAPVSDFTAQQAYGDLHVAAEKVGRILTHHRASLQPLTLPQAVVDKLTEAREALFAAQRLMEGEG